MHRLPSIFSRSSDGRKDRIHSSSSRQASKPKRLDRCNAMKNIDYESSPSTSASSSSSSSKESLRRRSMNLYGDRPSFRVDGTDGEFEIICQTYGFSGIDDFSVSPEEYEAMKVRSSSVPAVFNQKLERVNYQKSEVDCDGSAQFSCDRGVHVISRNMEDNDKYGGFSDNSSDIIDGRKFEEGRHFGYMDRSWVNDFSIGVSEQSKSFGNGLRVNDVISVDTTSRRSNAVHKNGVMGMQPPVLVPPPLMMLPVIKKESSTHDKSGGFLFNSETCVSGPERGFCLDEDEKGGQNRTEQEKHMRRRTIAREGKHVLLEPYYFTTAWNDDDDSWSTTKEPLSNVPPNGKYTRVIEDWQKGELLGCGSFGSVYEGIADDGFFFAVKEVSLLDQGDEGKQCITQLEQEISLLSQFDHSNIVQYYGTKKDESHLYIFLELVTKGSLLSIYQKYELRVPQVSAYTRQILHGLKYLHDRNVVHRDIKCANILVDTNGSVKLADFGLAKATKLNDLKSCKGTAFWMAPEVVRSNRYGRAADIWSLGCTVLEMLTRRFPYSNMEWMSALLSIGKGEGPLIPDSLSSDARAFIHNCLQVNPSLRPTAAQLLDHPFVKRPLASSSGTLSPHSFSRRI